MTNRLFSLFISKPPLRLRYLEYNSTKGVDVRTLARHVMELSDVQLYQLSAIRHFVSQTGLLVIFRDI